MYYILRRRKLGRTSCKEIAANSKKGIKVIRNDKEVPEDAEVVFRWGCTSNVPKDADVINHAKGIHEVSDKLGFRLSISALQPHWPVFHDGAIPPPEGAVWPLVVRPTVHHQGRNFHVAKDPRELAAVIKRINGNWYAAPLIKKEAEYRVFIVSGRAICVARKYPPESGGDAWNVHQGGRFENVRWDEWPLKAVRVSIEAFLTTGLDFGGVDIMVDPQGEVYILEVNSAPSLTSPYRQKCFALALDYIIDHGQDVIKLMDKKGGYKKFIHPAVCEQAVVVGG